MEYTSSIGYKKIQSEISTFLDQFDFIRHKTSTLFRVKNEELLQFINFQKGVQSLASKVTINIVLQGLFSPTCSFQLLQPGGRIGFFSETMVDKWWLCDNPDNTENSIEQIKNILEKSIIPFFEKTSSAAAVCQMIDKDELNFLWSNPYTFIDKGFFYLKGGVYEKALKIFESHQPSKVPKFKTIKNLISLEKYEEVQIILNDNVKSSKDKLGL